MLLMTSALSGYRGFLPKFRDVLIRLIGNSKLPVSVKVSLTCAGCTPPLVDMLHMDGWMDLTSYLLH